MKLDGSRNNMTGTSQQLLWWPKKVITADFEVLNWEYAGEACAGVVRLDTRYTVQVLGYC